MATLVNWYFEKEELAKTASIKRGMRLEVEKGYRKTGAKFLIDLGSSMELSTETKATGVVYFHRFYVFHAFQEFPRYPTALACLFLAGKAEESPRKCMDLLERAKEQFPEQFAKFGCQVREPREWTEEIKTLEKILLQTLKFDLDIEHPYEYLIQYAKCFKGNKKKIQRVVRAASNFVNQSFYTTLCLRYEPELVAIATLYLAGKLVKLQIVDWDNRKVGQTFWWDLFVEDLTKEHVENICHQVLDFYSEGEIPAPPDSPPPAAKKAVPGSVAGRAVQVVPQYIYDELGDSSHLNQLALTFPRTSSDGVGGGILAGGPSTSSSVGASGSQTRRLPPPPPELGKLELEFVPWQK